MIDKTCKFYKPGFRNDDVGMYINSHKCTILKLNKKDLECKNCRVRKPKNDNKRKNS